MKITEMVESKEATELSFWYRLKFNIHLALCKACRSYEKQSALIGKALTRLMSPSPENLKTMDGSTKQKMLDRIKKNDECSP